MNMDPRNISIEDFDYPLPDEKIARYPMQQRDQSKLLIYKDGAISEDSFSRLSEHLPADSLIIFNETRVIHARMIFKKESGSKIEVFCLEPSDGLDTQVAFQQRGSCKWRCLIGNAKRWKNGLLHLHVDDENQLVTVSVEKMERLDDTFLVRFSWEPEHLTFSEVLEIAGHIPLPPYLEREDQPEDAVTYQTLFARNDGSVAAPTAGLHFTPGVIESLSKKNIEVARITLHVGAGTFRPVSAETLEGHQMHKEEVFVPLEVINKLIESQDRNIILVGTTTVRTIESIYWQGLKWLQAEPVHAIMQVEQWDPYSIEQQPRILALRKVKEILEKNNLPALRGTTSLLIAPGYRFQFPDLIITNFHQPKSTLLLLVSAFIGEGWRDAYDYALEHDFRFLSYGDSCLFFKKV
jgi:S-adenosylmethionine:tRNA ribosyltransferase-isomerase